MPTTSQLGHSPYQYTDELLALERCTGSGTLAGIPLEAHTPLNTGVWEKSLRKHPDERFIGYIVRGLRNGFRIKAVKSQLIRSADRNLPSAAQHPDVIMEHVTKEAQLSLMFGPCHPSTFSGTAVQINRVGALPKEHSNKWRIITDL